MKNPLLILLLLSCLVVAMSTPVSAGDYVFFKDVNATDMVDELIRYVNTNCSIDDWGWELSKHKVEEWNETPKVNVFDLMFTCKDWYHFPFIPFIFPGPVPMNYEFSGVMHVDNPKDVLKKPYTLTITDDDKNFTAVGKNWRLEVWNTLHTRFKV